MGVLNLANHLYEAMFFVLNLELPFPENTVGRFSLVGSKRFIYSVHTDKIYSLYTVRYLDWYIKGIFIWFSHIQVDG